MSLTTDPNDPRIRRDGAPDKEPVPQHEVYLVLSDEERSLGFQRPYRDIYKHVGKEPPKYPLRDLTEEELERFPGTDWVKYEKYPPGKGALGRYWSQAELDNKGCGTTTTMARAIAETYAREPHFYGFTYCCHCRKHLPVEEFVWYDGTRVGS